jgi:hypothetical protein
VGYSYFGVLRQKLNWTLMPVGSLSGANTGPYTSSPGSYPGTPLI